MLVLFGPAPAAQGETVQLFLNPHFGENALARGVDGESLDGILHGYGYHGVGDGNPGSFLVENLLSLAVVLGSAWPDPSLPWPWRRAR